MGFSIIKNETLTAIADSVRGLLGITDKMKPSEMPDYIASAVNANGNIDKLLDKTIESVTINVTKIPDYTFQNCTNIMYFGGENVTTIGNSAFRNCYALSLVKLSPDIATESGTLHIPSGVTLYDLAFASCRSIKKIIIDDGVTFVGAGHFTSVGAEEVQLPSDMTEIPIYFFRYLPAETLDLPGNIVKLQTQCLRYSYVKKLIIRHTDEVINMVNSDVLWESEIAKGNGYIYVPDGLVESYKSATNWSAYANQIKSINELN